jgi:hypothetical protein
MSYVSSAAPRSRAAAPSYLKPEMRRDAICNMRSRVYSVLPAAAGPPAPAPSRRPQTTSVSSQHQVPLLQSPAQRTKVQRLAMRSSRFRGLGLALSRRMGSWRRDRTTTYHLPPGSPPATTPATGYGGPRAADGRCHACDGYGHWSSKQSELNH